MKLSSTDFIKNKTNRPQFHYYFHWLRLKKKKFKLKLYFYIAFHVIKSGVTFITYIIVEVDWVLTLTSLFITVDAAK